MTPARARPTLGSSPPLRYVSCHVKAMWIHTNKKVWPMTPHPLTLHMLEGNLWPLTFSMVEVGPCADWPDVEVPLRMRETRAGGQEYRYSAIKTTEQWQKHKGSRWTQWAHSAQTLLQRGKVPGQNMADPSLKTSVFEIQETLQSSSCSAHFKKNVKYVFSFLRSVRSEVRCSHRLTDTQWQIENFKQTLSGNIAVAASSPATVHLDFYVQIGIETQISVVW